MTDSAGKSEPLSSGAPTLAEIIALPAMARGDPEVLAGATALGRRVRWVHVGELADIASLLSGGELVLTTGIALPEDSEGLTRFVDGLAGVDAAGLVIELGRRYTLQVPDALVGAARHHELPLIVLRRQVRYVEVTEAVHSRIVNAQLSELQASNEIHRVFTELSVRGAEIEDVIREVARVAGRSTVLENLSHQVLALEVVATSAAAVLRDWELRSRRVRSAGGTVYDPETGWLITSVGARESNWGRLVVIGPPATQPAERDKVLIERAAATLAVNRLGVRDQESLQRHTHRAVLAQLLGRGRVTAAGQLPVRGLDIPLDGRRLVGVVLTLREAREDSTSTAEAIRDISDAAAVQARRLRTPALVGPVDDTTVAVLLSLERSQEAGPLLERFATAILTPPAPGAAHGCVMGVGTAVEAVADARVSLDEALQVAEAARSAPVPPAGGRLFFRLPDVRLRGLLYLLRTDPRVQTFVERELGALLAFDAAHGTGLVPALRAYLDSGRNKSAAADAAHLSRPAFYARLAKVALVGGVDLDSPESCLSLHVALLALDGMRDAR